VGEELISNGVTVSKAMYCIRLVLLFIDKLSMSPRNDVLNGIFIAVDLWGKLTVPCNTWFVIVKHPNTKLYAVHQ